MPRPGKPQSAAATATATTNSSSITSASVRARKPAVAAAEKRRTNTPHTGDGPASSEDDEDDDGYAAGDSAAMPSWAVRNRWIVFAVASGACAAFNGVFAKLTTNELSTHIARGISGLFGLTDLERVVEIVVRASFFGLNLVFNGVMWTLFTQALAKGNSTTQVSIMNTSANFVITALLGLVIFSESLPPLWWAGAALLVVGNVIIGRGKQEEGSETAAILDEGEYHDEENVSDDHDAESAAELGRGTGVAPQVEGILPVEKDDEDEDVALLGDLS
ncbi:hypothetical protein F4813DRAFT_262541 [Daldinia decipiens]|uniref:uncharacterized protein n=1 Tax=Daldinia decipiens TaxID=326647 RepID=UPI0020C2803F|nr:uncharacterized protein F4813DRAFT_262541 [Daldinia decipiens]KAI1660742.1 hypothetical protein F4813DRAFT_262541 [Daldinia decipiens]